MEAAGQPTEDAAAGLAKWRTEQDDFTKQTGLKRQFAREEVGGFGRSEAANADWAAKNDIAKYSYISYNKDGTIKVTDDWTGKSRPTLPASYEKNAVIETRSQGGKQKNRTIYTERFMGNTKTKYANPYRKSRSSKVAPVRKVRKTRSRYFVGQNNEVVRTTRELTAEERKANDDLLKGDD